MHDRRPVPALCAMLALAMAPATPALAAESYKVDPVHTEVIFRVKHLETSWSFGRFNDFSGTLCLQQDERACRVRYISPVQVQGRPTMDEGVVPFGLAPEAIQFFGKTIDGPNRKVPGTTSAERFDREDNPIDCPQQPIQ